MFVSPRTIFDLLYIEDQPYDLEVVRAVLKDRNHRLRFNSVPDARDAVEYMNRRGKYADAPLPDLIILDLKQTDNSGFQFLRLRSHDPLWRIPPVVVFVADGNGINTCYDLGASACILKPHVLDELAHLIVEIDKFWFKTVTLPLPEWKLRKLLLQVNA